MAIEVFNRFEKKFVLSGYEAYQVQNQLLDRMEPDEYNLDHEFYTISNIYYDTDDNDLIRTSLSKPLYKEKLRLRAYGVPELSSKVYLEIKKKFRGRVNKRRTTLRLQEAYSFVETGEIANLQSYMNRQVVDEIAFFLKSYEISPKLYLAYDRRAYFDRENPDLRMTFDFNIRSRRADLRLEHGDHGDVLLDDNQVVMEIKTRGSLPLWLAGYLSEHELFRTSFSKYGREYQGLLMRNRATAEEPVYA